MRWGSSKPNRHWALKDVSFDLYEGECLGIIGGNGAGKSTLLRLIAGIHRPNQGTMDSFGNTVALLTLGAGFSSHLSGRDNMILSGKLLGLSTEAIKERLPSMIEYSELGKFIDEPIYGYSTGMRARLGFAVAVQSDAKVLLIDETLGVGDAAFREKSSQTIQQMILSENRTVVLITHNHQTIQELSTRVIALKDGKVKEGDTDELIQEYLRESYARVAKKSLEELNDSNKSDAVRAKNRAIAWNNSMRQAIDVFDQSLIRDLFQSQPPREEDPLANHRHYMYAAAYLGEYSLAIKHIEQSEKLKADSSLSHLQAWYHFALGDIQTCKNEFVSSLDQFGGSRDKCNMLSYLCALECRWQDATRFLNLMIGYDSPMLASKLGVTISELMSLGFSGVRDRMLRSLETNPKAPKRPLAYACYLSGDFQGASRFFGELDGLAETDSVYYARALRITGDTAASKAELKKAIKKVPRSLTLIVELASLEALPKRNNETL